MSIEALSKLNEFYEKPCNSASAYTLLFYALEVLQLGNFPVEIVEKRRY